MRVQADWMDVGMIIHYQWVQTVRRERTIMKFNLSRSVLHLDSMEIQPTTEHTSGDKLAVGTSASALR